MIFDVGVVRLYWDVSVQTWTHSILLIFANSCICFVLRFVKAWNIKTFKNECPSPIEWPTYRVGLFNVSKILSRKL